MITYANNTQKDEIVSLWRTCFPDDTDAFIRLYFEQKYRCEQTLVYSIDGRIVSSLQMLPYSMNCFGVRIKAAYLSGVATLPAYRAKGYMKQLLNFAFDEMKKNGTVISVLIPQEDWLINYYRRFGYVAVFEHQQLNVEVGSCSDNSIKVFPVSKESIDKTFAYFDGKLMSHPHCILHDYDDYKVIMKDCRDSGGDVVFATNGDDISGICFITDQRGNVSDLWVDSPDAQTAIFAYIAKTYSVDSIGVKSAVSKQNRAISRGMVKLIDAERMMRLYVSKLRNEGEACNLFSEAALTDALAKGDTELLCRLLFGYRIHELPKEYRNFEEYHPYMSLMLD